MRAVDQSIETDESLLSQFRAFVTQASSLPIRESTPSADGALPIVEFESFLAAAIPIAIADVKHLLGPSLATRAQTVAKWLVEHDLLAVAGLSYVEDGYTELMAWALPSGHANQSRAMGRGSDEARPVTVASKPAQGAFVVHPDIAARMHNS